MAPFNESSGKIGSPLFLLFFYLVMVLRLPCFWTSPSIFFAWKTMIGSSTPNSNSLSPPKAPPAHLGSGLTEHMELLSLCCPCDNLFAHQHPYIIPHLLLLSNTMTGVYWQSVNTCYKWPALKQFDWRCILPSKDQDILMTFHLVRLLEKQKVTEQDGKSSHNSNPF